MRKLYCLFFLSIILSSCAYNRDIRVALRFAGDNRAELEKVLEHYADDDRKLRAAKFLIANMPGHYSYVPEKIADFKREYERIMFNDSLAINQKKEQLESLSKRHNLDTCIIEDVKLISAEYLIDNIDRSFEIWDNEPYCQHLNFDQFCELILPYKVVELQEFDDWKTDLANIHCRIDAQPHDDESHESTQLAAKLLTQDIAVANGVHFNTDYHGYTLINKRALQNVRFGSCDTYSISAMAIMRSKGIPTCFERMPQWAQKPIGHAWHTILNDNGAYLPVPWNWESAPGDAFFPNHKIPKIFRDTYAANPFFEEYANNSQFKLPRFTKFQEDVTNLYVGTYDLTIPIKRNGIKEKYVYLAVFNNTEWNPIDLGVAKWGKARFNNVGLGIVYIVLGFNGEKLIPISEAFLLEATGDVSYLTPQEEVLNRVKLTRKYPKSKGTALTEDFILGGQIQVANNADFSDADTIYVIKDHEYPDLIKTNKSKQYRYVRYSQNAPSKNCTLAEFQVFTDGHSDKPAKGETVASEQELYLGLSELSKAFDNDWLTSYTSQFWAGWIGLDLGAPMLIDGVRIVPRSDDNEVHFGDTYELKYWGNGGWVSLGEQVAKERFVIYDGVPKNALLLLSNKTRGKEERIFTYDNGKVRWW